MKTITDSKHTAYIWINGLYMNEKQWGIQTAHCVSDMSLMKYGKDAYVKWASEDKTIIMFNGKNSGTIKLIYTILEHIVHRLKFEIPYVIFREDEESLDGAATACGFIFPDYIRESITDTYENISTEYMYDLVLSGRQFSIMEFVQWMRQQKLA